MATARFRLSLSLARPEQTCPKIRACGFKGREQKGRGRGLSNMMQYVQFPPSRSRSRSPSPVSSRPPARELRIAIGPSSRSPKTENGKPGIFVWNFGFGGVKNKKIYFDFDFDGPTLPTGSFPLGFAEIALIQP